MVQLIRRRFVSVLRVVGEKTSEPLYYKGVCNTYTFRSVLPELAVGAVTFFLWRIRRLREERKYGHGAAMLKVGNRLPH